MKNILYTTRKELCQRLGVDGIVITKEPKEVKQVDSPLVKQLLGRINDEGIVLGVDDYPPHDKKILTIKTLRDFASTQGVCLALGDAKFAVEHFPEYLEIMNKTNSFPAIVVSASGTYLAK